MKICSNEKVGIKKPTFLIIRNKNFKIKKWGIKLAISLNTKVLFMTKANSLSGMIGNKNGDVLVGDKAFEFY